MMLTFINFRELEEDHEDETDKLRNQLEADKTQMQTAKDKEIGKKKKTCYKREIICTVC